MGTNIIHTLVVIALTFNQSISEYRKYANNNRGYYCFQVPFLPWMRLLMKTMKQEEASRAELMKLLFAYLKEQNLKDPENGQFFTPDKKMSKVFGKDKIRAFSMSKFIGEHLTPIDE